MPNHVTSICTVLGPEEDVARFSAAHFVGQVIEGKKSPTFSFNSVIPMPACIRETESGTDGWMGLLALRGEFPKPKYGFQPQNVDEHLERYAAQTGGAKTIFQLLTYLKENRPRALVEGAKIAHALDETGFTDWYEWSCEKWGTKWDAYQTKLRTRFDGCMEFEFQSAWSFPQPVFAKLSAMYPALVFSITAFDEGWNFACLGEFNGKGDYRTVEATDELYEKVYGRKPEREDDA